MTDTSEGPRDALSARLAGWLRTASALWVERGLDERGLFHERLRVDGVPDATAPRRVLVQGRQLYALSEACAGGVAGAREAVARAWPAVARHAWAVDGAPGWIHVLAPDGAPRDLARDTYDQSFLLFGLTAVASVGFPEAVVLAREGWRFVDTLRDPAGGYAEGRPATLPRRSNPHMHLLEAALAAFRLTGDAEHLARANGIAELFAVHFFHRATGTLTEFFDAALEPVSDVVEPGHMFEWSWLLHRLAEAGGRDEREAAARMHAWARAHGRDAVGFAIDETDRDGRPRRATRRAWPQTEMMKSLVANGEVAQARRVAAAFCDTYLATEVAGLWTDQFDAAGRPLSEFVPASTFYHIVVAFAELLSCSG